MKPSIYTFGILLGLIAILGFARESHALTSGQKPRGAISMAYCNQIAGWAYDPQAFGREINVFVYKDGPAGSGKLIASPSTVVYRGDVNEVYVLSGNHGFATSTIGLFDDGREHLVYVYAADINGNNLSALTDSPSKVQCGTQAQENRSVNSALILDQISGQLKAAIGGGLSAQISCNNSKSTTVPYGGGMTLKWSSSGAAACKVVPIGRDTTSGQDTVTNITQPVTYKICCSNVAGDVACNIPEESAFVRVNLNVDSICSTLTKDDQEVATGCGSWYYYGRPGRYDVKLPNVTGYLYPPEKVPDSSQYVGDAEHGYGINWDVTYYKNIPGKINVTTNVDWTTFRVEKKNGPISKYYRVFIDGTYHNYDDTTVGPDSYGPGKFRIIVEQKDEFPAPSINGVSSNTSDWQTIDTGNTINFNIEWSKNGNINVFSDKRHCFTIERSGGEIGGGIGSTKGVCVSGTYDWNSEGNSYRPGTYQVYEDPGANAGYIPIYSPGGAYGSTWQTIGANGNSINFYVTWSPEPPPPKPAHIIVSSNKNHCFYIYRKNANDPTGGRICTTDYDSGDSGNLYDPGTYQIVEDTDSLPDNKTAYYTPAGTKINESGFLTITDGNDISFSVDVH